MSNVTTREKLLETAMRLLAEEGYEAVGLREVAAASGVTTGSIYHHFSGKEDLFRSAVDYYSEQVANDVEHLGEGDEPGLERLAAAAEWLATESTKGWRNDFGKAAWDELRRVPGIPQGERSWIRSGFASMIATPIHDAVANGEIVLPDGYTVDELSDVVVAGVIGILQFTGRGLLTINVERGMQLYMRVVLAGLQTDPTSPPPTDGDASPDATPGRQAHAIGAPAVPGRTTS